MPVRVGNTEIASLGKIKLGTTNITKVFRGSVQIWPVLNYVQLNRSISGFATANLACADIGNPVTIVYQQLTTNKIFTDAALTNTFNGLTQWYLFYSESGGVSNYRINYTGDIMTDYNCDF
jgi:hypothetical protein